MAKFVLMALLTIGLRFGAAYKILLVFPFPSSSHGILGDGFVRHLLGAGHEVCMKNSFFNGCYNINMSFIHLVDYVILITHLNKKKVSVSQILK